ncbi:hypothetical protein [Butyrivibrio sp. AC2005]|uniref:hypothetical protein n=1 Tax=Butyrivibrio sp. AC2005 TaxID=1280672 RepID=UPI0012DCABEC|nr:hypothetical protein [Butyrivibrio sp. AC2005]
MEARDFSRVRLHFDKKNVTVIDAVEHNGRYVDAAAIRNKWITAGAILFAAVAFVAAQIV